MKKLAGFNDLKARNIVKNRPTLKKMIERDGFPPGIKLGPRLRKWDEQEVDTWLESRPKAG
jgi:predicted DNA-binding transcriptional regulator AlpA